MQQLLSHSEGSTNLGFQTPHPEIQRLDQTQTEATALPPRHQHVSYHLITQSEQRVHKPHLSLASVEV